MLGHKEEALFEKDWEVWPYWSAYGLLEDVCCYQWVWNFKKFSQGLTVNLSFFLVDQDVASQQLIE